MEAQEPNTEEMPEQVTDPAMTEEQTPIHGIGWAVKQLWNGLRVAREGWNGKDMFLYLVNGSNFKVNRPPLLGFYKEGDNISYHAHIDMKTAGGYCVPWVASQTDLLNNDWFIVKE